MAITPTPLNATATPIMPMHPQVPLPLPAVTGRMRKGRDGPMTPRLPVPLTPALKGRNERPYSLITPVRSALTARS